MSGTEIGILVGLGIVSALLLGVLIYVAVILRRQSSALKELRRQMEEVSDEVHHLGTPEERPELPSQEEGGK
jgi:hypothetical protein